MTELMISEMNREEAMLLQLVKQKMLQKLNDRYKFIFLYVFEMGNNKQDAAQVLGVSNALVTRYIERIRHILSPFKEGVKENT